MRGGGRTDYLYREITPVLISDLAFLAFLESRSLATVKRERFVRSPAETIKKKYQSESERLLREIRMAKRNHLQLLKEAS